MKIKSVFIVPPRFGAEGIFKRNGYELSPTVDDADAIVLMGGEDINPALYKQDKHPKTWFNQNRDDREVAFIDKFRGKKPFIGICRGAQLLNVKAGGSMWQHVNNHSGVHVVHVEPYKQIKRYAFEGNSVHHQMMRPTDKAEIIGFSVHSTLRECMLDGALVRQSSDDHEDPEIVYYPDDAFFCWQGHPEFGHAETAKNFFDIMPKAFAE